MLTDEVINHIEQLIDDAQILIKDQRKDELFHKALEIEKFINLNSLPIDSEYEEKDYYTFNIYPIMNFLDITKDYNYNFREKILNEEEKNLLANNDLSHRKGKCIPQIYNFVHVIFYEQYKLAEFKNIFYPHNNHKFVFDTYQGPGRFDKNIQLTYIHPKYQLEEMFHRLYSPEYYNENISEKINYFIDKWKSIDEEYTSNEVTEYRKINLNNFSLEQKKILEIINDKVIKCFYDTSVPIVITSSRNLNFIEENIKNLSHNYQRLTNSSKAFFDNRAENIIFKINGKTVLKVFPLLDYELIPCLPWDNNKCHIDVMIRLSLNEFITYQILGINEIARIKLKIYMNLKFLRDKLGDKITDIKECKFKGKYYPYHIYLSEQKSLSVLSSKK